MFNIQNVSNCETSTVLVAPPTHGAIVTINGYQLNPSPFVNVTIEKNVVNDTIIGGVMKVQLNGTVVGSSFNETVTGCDSEGDEITTKTSLKKILELSRNSCCINLIIKCGCDFIDGKGRIIGASLSEGNDPTWVTRASYTIEVELYTNKVNGSYLPVVNAEGKDCPNPSSEPNPSPSPGPCVGNLLLKDLSEQFSISIDEDSFNFGVVPPSGEDISVGRRHAKVSFSISAKGIGGGSGNDGEEVDCFESSTEGGESQKTYVGLAAVERYMKCRIDKLRTMDLSGIAGAPDAEITHALSKYTEGKSYLDFRTLEVNPVDKSMSITGDIIYRPVGCDSDVFTSMTVEESVDSEGSQITISGNIEGLVEVDYSFMVNPEIASNLIAASGYLGDTNCEFNTKMQNALVFFGKIDDEEKLKKIALAHCSKPVLVVKCINDDELVPCVSESPYPTPSFACSQTQMISRQVSKDYAAGTINFTFVFSNKSTNCSSIPGISNVEIEATHDLPKDNIVETVVPGRGKKGVLIQNLCCLSADRWSFNINLTIDNSSKIKSPLKLKTCARNLLKKFIEDSEIDPDPVSGCWFVTDHQETLGNKSYRYNIQYTKPSCP